jgi:hypothetical protein
MLGELSIELWLPESIAKSRPGADDYKTTHTCTPTMNPILSCLGIPIV